MKEVSDKLHIVHDSCSEALGASCLGMRPVGITRHTMACCAVFAIIEILRFKNSILC